MIVRCKESGTALKNTGTRGDQCFEGLAISTAWAKPGFSFDSVDDAEGQDKWIEAIANKDIYPLFAVEELAIANTEDTFFQGRVQRYKTADGAKISTYSSFLGPCSYADLKSFDGVTGQLFEFTKSGKIKGIDNLDGTIGGQSVTLDIGPRLDATADRPSSALVTINYLDADQYEDNPAVLAPDWDPTTTLFGIFDVILTQISASATVVKFTVSAGCSAGEDLTSDLESGDVVLKNLSNSTVSTTFTAADSNKVYTLTGTSIASGFKVVLNGVVTKTKISYESPEPLVLVVS